MNQSHAELIIASSRPNHINTDALAAGTVKAVKLQWQHHPWEIALHI